MKEHHSMNVVQRWFQSVITNAAGVEEGIRSPATQELVGHFDAQKLIRPSRRLTSLERLAIYANAYHARLLECMGSYFPVLKRALGAELFDSFVIEYLQEYPSQSYTLDRLGNHFTQFLSETRPVAEHEGEEWPDFLIDLATLEWTIARIYDGPGTEGKELLTPEILNAFPRHGFTEARLLPVVSMELLAFRYPVSAYYTAIKRAEENEEFPLPEPSAERIAVFRRDYIVRRYPLSEPQFRMLRSILNGDRMRDAISAAAALLNLDDDSLAAELRSWFYDWSRAGFFCAIS